MTPDQRRQYDQARHKRNHQAMMADPALRAQQLERNRRMRRERAARASNASTLPKWINAEVYRAHGPWAALFAMQSNTKVLTSKAAA